MFDSNEFSANLYLQPHATLEPWTHPDFPVDPVRTFELHFTRSGKAVLVFLNVVYVESCMYLQTAVCVAMRAATVTRLCMKTTVANEKPLCTARSRVATAVSLVILAVIQTIMSC